MIPKSRGHNQNIGSHIYLNLVTKAKTMVVKVLIKKRSYTWSRLIKTQYVFGRSPTKNCVTSRIMIEKASNHIETVKLSLRNDCILAFLCLNGKKHLGLMLCLYISNKFQVLKYFV